MNKIYKGRSTINSETYQAIKTSGRDIKVGEILIRELCQKTINDIDIDDLIKIFNVEIVMDSDTFDPTFKVTIDMNTFTNIKF